MSEGSSRAACARDRVATHDGVGSADDRRSTDPASSTFAARLLAGRRAVVFDLDGTLVDTLPDLVLALNAALAEVGAPAVAPTLVRDTLHGGLEATARAALRSLDLPATLDGGLARSYARHYARAPACRSTAYDGVPALLDALARRGARLAVCTNKRVAQAERVLDATGLIERFVTVVGADSCERRKPDPQPLHEALRRLGFPGDDAVLVGDSQVDVETARAAGVDCVLHTGGYGVVDEREPGVGARFGDYRALLAAIRR